MAIRIFSISIKSLPPPFAIRLNRRTQLGLACLASQSYAVRPMVIRWLLRINLAMTLGWFVRLTTWSAVLLLGLGTWWQVRVGSGDWSLEEAQTQAMGDPVWLGVIVIAAFFVFADPGKKLLVAARRRNLEEDRADYLITAMESLNRFVKRRSVKDDMKRVWEPLLVAVQKDVARELGLPEEGLKANLLLCEHENKVRVVARSKPGSPVPVTYSLLPRTASTAAISENKTYVSSTIPDDKGRPYKCVVASPVANGEKMFGTITVDSASLKDFKGKEALLDAILLPYCSLILLTLDDNIYCVSCPARYRR